MRNGMFRHQWVSGAKIAFQACSFNHSDISPSLESITYGVWIEPKVICALTLSAVSMHVTGNGAIIGSIRRAAAWSPRSV